MAFQLTFLIPDDKKDLFIDAFAQGWLDTIDGQPNPETKPQFAKRQIKQMFTQHVRMYQAQQIPEIDIT